MSTFGTMVAEIRAELRRSNMDTAIKRGICAAVLYLKDKRYKWNELSFTLDLIADQQDYDSADDADIGRLASIDSVKLVSPADILTSATIEEIRRWTIGASSGSPTHYAFYESALWLYPKPNSSTLDLNILGLLELQDTSQSAGSQIITRTNFTTIPDAYTTAWFTDGFEIVKSWAKGYIYHNHLRNKTEATNDLDWFKGLDADAQNQIGKLGGTSFVRPTAF